MVYGEEGMKSNIFHSSKKQGIKKIVLSISTHGKKWVYALKDKVFSALFLSSGAGDLMCAIGRDPVTNKACVSERYKGVFNYRYSNKKGLIYCLSGKTFVKNKTTWSEEVVSEKEIIPLDEEKINDVKKYIIDLQNNGELIIKFFPKLMRGIPQDKSDIIEKSVDWIEQGYTKTIINLKKFHPELVPIVTSKLNSRGIKK